MKVFLTLATVFFLASCGSVEMPIAPEGSDELRKSPCVCLEVPYQFEGFEWHETA